MGAPGDVAGRGPVWHTAAAGGVWCIPPAASFTQTATDVEDASEGDAGGLATAVSTVLDQAESALLQSVGGILGTFIVSAQ